MDKDIAITKIKSKIEEIATLQRLPRFCPEYKKWSREVHVLLSKIFGEESYQRTDFGGINFVFSGMRRMDDTSPIERRYRVALEEARAILTSICEEIEEFGIPGDEGDTKNPISNFELLFLKFHSVARQLRNRHSDRPTIDVADEYDVQDLLHALLRIHFKDIRPEEWTPSYAGSASRMDFLLKDEGIVIEVKMTRIGLNDKTLVDQLLIDIARYEEHPDCKHLICFVYDPDGRIGNPSAVISDLEKRSARVPVRVFIQPAIT